MSHTPQHGVIRKIKYVFDCPWFANILKHEDMLFNHKPGTRYPLTLGVNNLKMYSTMKPTSEEDQVVFSNVDYNGGCQRIFINSKPQGVIDYNHDAYICIYYSIVKELYWVGVEGDEARFGGIVVAPMCLANPIMKVERMKFLMNRWRKVAHLVGKWAIVLKNLYTEVSYRPGNQGAIDTLKHFNTAKHFNTVVNNVPNRIIINNIPDYPN